MVQSIKQRFSGSCSVETNEVMGEGDCFGYIGDIARRTLHLKKRDI
jgi:hypothetical protein